MFSYCSFIKALLPLCFKSEQDCINPYNICYIKTFNAALKYVMAVCIVLIAVHIMRQENNSQQLIYHGAIKGILSYASFIFYVLNHVCFS